MIPNSEDNSLSFSMTDNHSKTILTDGGESQDNDEETEEEQPEDSDEETEEEQPENNDEETDEEQSEDSDTSSQTGEGEDQESVTSGGGETEQDEQTEETHGLTVAVENREGEPVPQANLTIESDDMGVIEGFLDDAEQQGTDSSGEATFELENAEYTVEAVTNGEELERTVEIDGDDEQITLTVDSPLHGFGISSEISYSSH